MTLSKLDIYIEDDWNDNKLKNRDNVSEGYFLHPSDNLQDFIGDVEAGGALKGIYRPNWQNDGGCSSSDQELKFTSGNSGKIWTPSELLVGSGRCNFRSTGTGYSNGGISLAFLASSANIQSVYSSAQANGEFGIVKYDGSSYSDPILSSWTPDTSNHKMKITRDVYSNWEVFLDGSSQGTTTDSFVPPNRDVIHLRSTIDETAAVDNLKVK